MMQVREAMSGTAEFLPSDASLEDAARMMRDLEIGFLPIGDRQQDRLLGIITDRDITVRAVAEGKDPRSTKASDMKTEGVMYCYQGDSVEEAANSMRDLKTYRLVVLDNAEDKRFVGVVSLADILRQNNIELGAQTAKVIVSDPNPAA